MHHKSNICRNWLVGLACLWLTAGGGFSAGKNSGVSEYQVKAAFLYNFIKFTDWPGRTFASAEAPIVIGIVGDDPFGKTLDDVVKDELVHQRPLILKRFRADEDLGSCQVLFICNSEKERVAALLNQLKGKPVLTTSDAPGFAEQGGMVNLLLVKDSVKLEINQAVAEASGLQISGKLLSLARIVKSK